MKRTISHWRLIPKISLILSVMSGAQPAQSQTQTMDADFESRPMLEKGEVARKPMVLPDEPLLFETENDLSPSAMLQDQDDLAVPHVTQLLEEKEKPHPSVMPSEPTPN